MKHAKDCRYYSRQYPKECDCGLVEAQHRVASALGSWGAPGFEACVQAELAEMRSKS